MSKPLPKISWYNDRTVSVINGAPVRNLFSEQVRDRVGPIREELIRSYPDATETEFWNLKMDYVRDLAHAALGWGRAVQNYHAIIGGAEHIKGEDAELEFMRHGLKSILMKERVERLMRAENIIGEQHELPRHKLKFSPRADIDVTFRGGFLETMAGEVGIRHPSRLWQKAVPDILTATQTAAYESALVDTSFDRLSGSDMSLITLDSVMRVVPFEAQHERKIYRATQAALA